MDEKIIDLRSDTVTKPSAAMRRAMAEAEVGDDVYIEDPTVNRLQARAAEIFGREAGLFVPSGSMGNLTCIMAQASRGQEVICEAAGHIYNYEMAAMSAIGGVLPRVVPAEDGIMTWEQIAPAIREKAYYRPQTALVALENTHNMAGGTVYPTRLGHKICDQAHEAGLKVHLDGARVFNAAVHLGENVAEMTKKFDSVQFCLSKGLGAPIGSMIVGSRDFIERCRVIRKTLGGGMRQVGVIAAAGLVALEEGPKRLHVDHDNAKILAEGLAKIARIRISPEKVQTNIVIFDLGETGLTSKQFLERLAQRKVLGGPVDARRIRMVTHLDVDRNDIEQALKIIGEVVVAGF
ncbi:MAG: aminotransferase class I/II-fold pyridoxal phosphate-dependent enzyme [Deltaproteobacteria bacterium]|nr:aminotransferase class I/II-fold pyridoxal phosphate-dependent enzyme [Deltaproteobacteria bacterium]